MGRYFLLSVAAVLEDRGVLARDPRERSPAGVIHYAAIHSSALPSVEIATNVERLTGNDDQ